MLKPIPIGILHFPTFLLNPVFDYFAEETYFHSQQTKLRNGNVFSSVCQQLCPRGDVSQHALGEGVADTPWADTPFWADRGCVADTPWADHPLGQTPPWQTPIPRQPLQQTVRILLECILVFNLLLPLCPNISHFFHCGNSISRLKF